jgi:hypothetical protein
MRHATALLALALVVVACGGGVAQTLVTYERDWPDGFHEEFTLGDDGRLTMRHGETLERLTIDAADVQRIRDGLAAGLPMGEQGDSLVRTVILANGTSHSPVWVEPGSVVELLETLMTTHSLTGSPPPGSPLPRHGMDAHASP